MAGKATKPTLREWLAQHGRNEPIHYKDIAEAMKRDPASVSASLSIEMKQAKVDNRPAYFMRTGPGLYQYNDLCEGAIDEELIKEVTDKAADFERATRREMRHEISKLNLVEFEHLAEIVLTNIRARTEQATVVDRYNGNIIFVTSWRDDGGQSPVVVFARKCEFDEKIGFEFIREIRGTLQNHMANQGVLITNGIVSEAGKLEALGYTSKDQKIPVQPVHIMDINIILNILVESRTGVREKQVKVLLLDSDFFKHLRNL